MSNRLFKPGDIIKCIHPYDERYIMGKIYTFVRYTDEMKEYLYVKEVGANSASWRWKLTETKIPIKGLAYQVYLQETLQSTLQENICSK